jgi:hypothetical protein
MYEKYFYSKIVDKALTSTEYTDETMESYMFRIINLTNKNTNLDALNGLRQIWKDLDIKNIGVIGNTELAFNVALVIYDTILNNLKDGIEETDENGNKTTKPNGSDGESSEGGSGDKDLERRPLLLLSLLLLGTMLAVRRMGRGGRFRFQRQC